MRGELAELILLSSRARVYQAERSKSEVKRGRRRWTEAIDRPQPAPRQLDPQAVAVALRRPGEVSRRARAGEPRPPGTVTDYDRTPGDHGTGLSTCSGRRCWSRGKLTAPNRRCLKADRARPPAVLGLVLARPLPLSNKMRFAEAAGDFAVSRRARSEVHLALDEPRVSPWPGPADWSRLAKSYDRAVDADPRNALARVAPRH